MANLFIIPPHLRLRRGCRFCCAVYVGRRGSSASRDLVLHAGVIGHDVAIAGISSIRVYEAGGATRRCVRTTRANTAGKGVERVGAALGMTGIRPGVAVVVADDRALAGTTVIDDVEIGGPVERVVLNGDVLSARATADVEGNPALHRVVAPFARFDQNVVRPEAVRVVMREAEESRSIQPEMTVSNRPV